MSWELKIKASTLAAEAKIIARIERKLKRMRNQKVRQFIGLDADAGYAKFESAVIPGSNPEGYQRWGNAQMLGVQRHRRGVLRREARRTHLARAFLKGTPGRVLEARVNDGNHLSPADWDAIHAMARKYARYVKISEMRPGWRSEQALAQAFEEWRQHYYMPPPPTP